MRITDPRAMRAMAHPLRIELIDLLGRIGPATAATCARRLGSTQALCSFHLRQLAKYGYVEEAESEDHRERPWKLTDVEQSWSREEGGAAATELEKAFVEREAARQVAWLEAARNAPPEWRSASFFGGVTAPMTAEELDGLAAGFQELLAPYIRRTVENLPGPEGSTSVRIVFSGSPYPDSFQE